MYDKQFADWFKDKWYSDDWEQLRESGISPAEFDSLPFCMKWGAYLEFFDSVGIRINMYTSQYNNFQTFGYEIIDKKSDNIIENETTIITRQAGQHEAVEKAFEILDKCPS